MVQLLRCLLIFSGLLISNLLYGQEENSFYANEPAPFTATGTKIQLESLSVNPDSVPQKGINNSPNPLFVVDGKLIGGGYSTEISAIQYRLSQSGIYSINFLPPIASRLRYGRKGENGAILVKTVAGSRQYIPKINFRTSLGIQWAYRHLDLLSSTEYAEVTNAAFINSGRAPVFDLPPGNDLADTDWQNELFRTGFTQDYYFSVRNKSRKFAYMLGGGHLNQAGIVRGSSLNRSNIKLSIDHNPHNILQLRLKSFVTHSGIHGITMLADSGRSEGLITQILETPPVIHPQSEFIPNEYFHFSRGITNPVLLQEKRLDRFNRWMMNHQLEGILNPGRHLVFTARFTNNLTSDHWHQFLPGQMLYRESEAHDNRSTVLSLRQEYIAGYNPEFYFLRDYIHSDIKFHFSHQAQFWKFDRNFATGLTSFSDPWDQALLRGNYLTRNHWQTINSGLSANIQFKALTFNSFLHTIYSDRFAQGKRSKALPGFSANLNLLQLHDLGLYSNRVFSSLVFQTGYGKTVNDQINSPGEIISNSWNHPQSIRNDLFVQTWGSAGSQNLLWETTGDWTHKIKGHFFQSRVMLAASFFRRNTRNTYAILPDTTGGFAFSNIGDIRNRGFEFESSLILGRNNLMGAITGNFTLLNSKIMKLSGGSPIFLASPIAGEQALENLILLQEGEQPGNFIGYRTDGLYQQGDDISLEPGKQPGDIRLVDIDGNGKIDEADRTIIGRSIPRGFYGFDIKLKYHHYSLEVAFNGAYGNDILNYHQLKGRDQITGATNLFSTVMDYWTPENTGTDIPRPSLNPETRITDRLIEKGDFLRLKYVRLKYKLTNIRISKTKSVHGNLFLEGTNLALWTRYSGYDPEIRFFQTLPYQNFSIDRGIYPRPRGINVGLDINF